MKISALKAQTRDKNRVNVFVDGAYSFSLDVMQVVELGIKSGNDYSEDELTSLKNESLYGKLYTRSLEYALVRPRSLREMRDYLYKKTRATRTKMGDIKEGVSPELTQRVYERLIENGYLNDEKFARFWVDNRNVRKGTSIRKLTSELQSKGVDASIIEKVLSHSGRSDDEEIQKIIAKKASKYDDERKLIAYLIRQGFRYDDIKQGLEAASQDAYEA